MNTCENARSQATKEKIYHALMDLLKRKNFNKIYVKDICAVAGINRSSFYEHYQDINDLMIKTEADLSQQVSTFFQDVPCFSKTSLIKFFAFIQSNAEFYSAFLTNHEGSLMDVNDFQAYIPKFTQNFHLKTGYAESEIIYHMVFFAAGLSALCKAWLKTGMKETPEQIAQILINEFSQRSKFFS